MQAVKTQYSNKTKLVIMSVIALICCLLYMFIAVKFHNPKLFNYAMKTRAPKLIVMLITSFAIGSASLVFQSIINNTIVTPCLLGMNSLYTLIHTAVFFFLGSSSIVANNGNVAFVIDLVLMGVIATFIYSYMFKKTNHNVLYVLLIGTVLTSFFSSIQTTLTRVMDPNEYDVLLGTLVASFSNVNTEVIVISVVILAGLIFVLRKEIAVLDVLTLGKDQAINLGVDYDKCVRKLLLGVTICIAVATAMVIAQDTEYVLLDEPTNNLDIYHATNLMKTVRRLCDELGKTVILVLHEINYAAFYSDYICAFKNGEVAKFGTVEEVITKENLSEIYNVDFEIMEIEGRPLSIYY